MRLAFVSPIALEFQEGLPALLNRGVVAQPAILIEPGQVFDFDEDTARWLLAGPLWRPATEPEAAPAAAPAEPPAGATPEPESAAAAASDEKSSRKGTAKEAP